MVVFAQKRNLSTFKIYRKQSDTSCFQKNHIQLPSPLVPAQSKYSNWMAYFLYEYNVRYMQEYRA